MELENIGLLLTTVVTSELIKENNNATLYMSPRPCPRLAACISRRLDGLVYAASAMERRTPQSHTVTSPGLFCTATCKAGTLLGIVPITQCVAPQLVAYHPVGTIIASCFSGGITVPSESNEQAKHQFNYSAEVCMTTVACALQLIADPHTAGFLPGADLHEYLKSSVSLSSEYDSLEQMLPSMNDRLRYQSIRRSTRRAVALMRDMLIRVATSGTSVEAVGSDDKDPSAILRHLIRRASPDELLLAMDRSNRICESRCVRLANDELCFGGPALTPFVDLLNHSDEEPNVTVAVITDDEEIDELVKLARRLGMHGAEYFVHRYCGGGSGTRRRPPPIVVAVASRDVAEGDEFHYQYVDPGDDAIHWNDAVYWAVRFHFVPERLR